jgi:hypothetical protein
MAPVSAWSDRIDWVYRFIARRAFRDLRETRCPSSAHPRFKSAAVAAGHPHRRFGALFAWQTVPRGVDRRGICRACDGLSFPQCLPVTASCALRNSGYRRYMSGSCRRGRRPRSARGVAVALARIGDGDVPDDASARRVECHQMRVGVPSIPCSGRARGSDGSQAAAPGALRRSRLTPTPTRPSRRRERARRHPVAARITPL